ncbi:hypothetical protein PYK79_51345 [Streptomyces sp. ID05-04B]|uniref:hypothetical protein n=1 Tax=unclassified Streptomyces TaxID=2593676 RepID=UPI00131F377A|nr:MULTISPECIES: hypothetical protein [unclassified Streptomyces]MDX5570013.1 hypothetical protein [Streptomyces sp. ID05-04B]
MAPLRVTARSAVTDHSTAGARPSGAGQPLIRASNSKYRSRRASFAPKDAPSSHLCSPAWSGRPQARARCAVSAATTGAARASRGRLAAPPTVLLGRYDTMGRLRYAPAEAPR